MKRTFRSGVTTTQLFVVVTVFVALSALAALQLIERRMLARTEAWASLEEHFRDQRRCTALLRGKQRGDSLDQLTGKEWQDSGWIVREGHILRAEDEVAWQLPKDEDRPHELYVLLSLIPGGQNGERLSVDQFLKAEAVGRLVKIEAEFSEDRKRAPASGPEGVIRKCKIKKALETEGHQGL